MMVVGTKPSSSSSGESFLTLKSRYKEVMIPSLSLEFGKDVMAGAVVAL